MNKFYEIVKINKDYEGVRLDNWIRQNYKQISYFNIQKIIRKGEVLVNSKKVIASYKLNENMLISVPKYFLEQEVSNATSSNLLKKLVEDLKKRILYEDNSILAFNKPHGLAAQGGTGLNIHLDDILKSLSEENKSNYKLVHRLDKNTSGVILVAKSKIAARELTLLFKNNLIRKTYWTVVLGLPKKTKGEITKSINKENIAGKEKMIVDELEGLKANTEYEVIDTKEDYSFLKVYPITGRKHQIRVHLSYIGNPILGDKKYGGEVYKVDNFNKKKPLMHLCAKSIVIKNWGNKAIKISAPLPKHMKETFSMLDFKLNSTD